MKLLLDKCPNCKTVFNKINYVDPDYNCYHCQSGTSCYQIIPNDIYHFFYYNMIYYDQNIEGATYYNSNLNTLQYSNRIAGKIFNINNINEVEDIRKKCFKFKSFT